MAENFDKFSISIDADVSSLQSSLKAAENTLAQFESALKKATSIGEINYLNNHIKNCEIYKANKSEISFITKK